MGQRKRRRFTDEFKKEAARLCLQHDRSIGQVAQELDLTESALRNWVKQYEIDRVGAPHRLDLRRAKGPPASNWSTFA